jgi:hypothetical protein
VSAYVYHIMLTLATSTLLTLDLYRKHEPGTRLRRVRGHPTMSGHLGDMRDE